MSREPDQWWDATWNPITMRCDRVGEGCQNCWALRFADRHACNPHFSDEIRSAYAGTGPPILREDVLEIPLYWKKPRRIAVQMMGDLFHANVKPEWIDRIYEVMAACPQHEFIVPTKRPHNIKAKVYGVTEVCPCRELGGGDYLPNLTYLVSAWDQKSVDSMIPPLLQITATRRGVSLEPLLNRVDLTSIQYPLWARSQAMNTLTGKANPSLDGIAPNDHLDLVLCGAETGPHARPMKLEWARDIRDQCKAAGVPFWFKKTSPGTEIPEDLLIREWPK